MTKPFMRPLYRFSPWESFDDLRTSLPRFTYDRPIRLYGDRDHPALDLGIKFTPDGLLAAVTMRHTFWDEAAFEKEIRTVAEHMGLLGLKPILNEHTRPTVPGGPRRWTRRTWPTHQDEQITRETRRGDLTRAIPHQIIVTRRFVQPAASQRPNDDLTSLWR